jgi:hypothetical protein
MDASKANSKSKAPLAVPIDACSEHVVWNTYQKDAHASVSQIELTSGIQSVEPTPKRRWHYRLFVSVTASSKAVRLLRLSRSSIRHYQGCARRGLVVIESPHVLEYKMGQLGRCSCLALDRD